MHCLIRQCISNRAAGCFFSSHPALRLRPLTDWPAQTPSLSVFCPFQQYNNSLFITIKCLLIFKGFHLKRVETSKNGATCSFSKKRKMLSIHFEVSHLSYRDRHTCKCDFPDGPVIFLKRSGFCENPEALRCAFSQAPAKGRCVPPPGSPQAAAWKRECRIRKSPAVGLRRRDKT